MIRLDLENDDYDLTSEATVLTHTLPASPTEHLVGAWIDCSNLHAGIGTLTVRATADDMEVFHSVIDKRDLTGRILSIPPLMFRAPMEIKLLLTSSNANDTVVDVTAVLSSHDLDYALSFQAAEASPTAGSLAKLIKDAATAAALSAVSTLVGQRATPAQVLTQSAAALAALHLDHLIGVACDSDDIAQHVVDNSILALILAQGGDISDYNDTTDSLEALRARLGGGGPIPFTYTLTEDDLVTPIAEALVQVYTDSAMTSLVTQAHTNTAGQAAFNLAAGTYYLRCTKSGYSFDNPDTEVVS